MRPILFTLPGLDWQLQSYGFFFGVALIVGWLSSLTLARRDGLPVEVLGTSFVLTAAFGLLGARAGWLLQRPDRFEGIGSIFVLQADGLAPFFGVAIGLAVSATHLRRHRIDVLRWWDAGAFAFSIGFVLERIGALVAGASHGRYAPDLPFAIRYPQGTPPYQAHLRHLAELMPADAEFSLPVHPTPIYGALLGLVGLTMCVLLRRRRTFDGQVVLTFAMYLLLARSFLEEPFRASAATPMFGPLNPGQLVALVFAAVLAVVYVARRRRAGARTQP